MMLMAFYYMNQKKDLSSHTPIKRIDIVAVRHFLKSVGLLKRGSIFNFYRLFCLKYSKILSFLCRHDTFCCNNYSRLLRIRTINLRDSNI